MSATAGLSDSAEYIGWRLEIFTAFFVPIQIIAVALRYYTRWLIKGPWGWDDVIVLVSLAFQMVMAGIGIGAVKQGGMGYHQLYLEETNPAILLTWGKYLTAISTLYFFIANIPKLAILALYHRLFPQRSTRIAIYVLAFILIGASLSTTIAALAACQPYEANFNPALPGAKCIDKESLFIWSSIPNIVTDVAMIVLPLPTIWHLHTNRRMKIGLTFTFLVGSFGLVTSILRFSTFFQNNSFTDGTFAAVQLMIWTQTEPGVYLISACLPTYRPLLERMGIGKLTAAATNRMGKSGNSGTFNGYAKKSRNGTVEDSIALNGQRKEPGFSKLDDSMGSRDEFSYKEPGQVHMRTDIHVWSERGDY